MQRAGSVAEKPLPHGPNFCLEHIEATAWTPSGFPIVNHPHAKAASASLGQYHGENVIRTPSDTVLYRAVWIGLEPSEGPSLK